MGQMTDADMQSGAQALGDEIAAFVSERMRTEPIPRIVLLMALAKCAAGCLQEITDSQLRTELATNIGKELLRLSAKKAN